MDFRISKLISGFQSGFQDFKVDFCIIFEVDLDFWAGHMAYKYTQYACMTFCIRHLRK